MTLRKKLTGRPPKAHAHFQQHLPTLHNEVVCNYHSRPTKLHFNAPDGPVFSLTIHSRLSYTLHANRELYSIDRLIEYGDKFYVCGRAATLNTDNFDLAVDYAANPPVLTCVSSLLQVIQ